MTTTPDLAPDSYDTWSAWIDDNPHAPEQDKLDTLRAFIYEAAVNHSSAGDITASWANKKLGPLGVVKRIASENAYVLEVPVNVKPVSFTIYAADRDEAVREFMAALERKAATMALEVEAASDPTFLSGPDDADPLAFDPNAPTTVAETLVKLRETILLAVVAGPKICVDGANELLAAFDLAHVPLRKRFAVTRPAEVEFTTYVEAFDEASAQRVAEWRWADDRSGYEVAKTGDEGDFAVSTVTVS